ncbi:S-methyl-5'-thioinosine phosphorylase [Aestuariicella hydrocarbonica]|uniref:Purine nucleoside phosphorylase n=1 Tax=Pseudomaricurvus hydrocarbonicus TaxID=1470433 RepID=A0A9E5T227_9GAMM|nr:S-methyl-5'-thioinosine phosphorylase [Aestuariicella hydrocarbonica]NHO68055.1 S-methyl-5'-thioinosine phosphorylase [Aestuariicella hydrocarbonica]
MASSVVKVAIIGGTGLSSFSGLDWCDSHRPETPFGSPSAGVAEGKYRGNTVLFLPRHGGEHSIAPHKINYRANIAALKALGVSHILAVNAVGGLAPDMGPHALVVPDQIIDYSSGRENSFFDGVGGPLDHIDFTDPYDVDARQGLLLAAQKCGIESVDGGVYGCTQGPRLETAAEIRRFRQDGCDLVGMTGMPEACLAREVGIKYASLCLVVNWGAGLTEEKITLDDIHRVMASGMDQVKRVLLQSIEQLNAPAKFTG